MAGQSIYDYPLYYDILFGWQRDAEAARYASIFQGCGAALGSRMLEMGCGTGQIGLRLAAAGWQVTGLDWSQAMLRFFRGLADEEGLAVGAIEVDMTDFRLEPEAERFAAAACALNSVGLLAGGEGVVQHLRAMGEALRAGAPYVLDVTVGASTGPAVVEDEWGFVREGVEVWATPESIVVADPDLAEELKLSWGPPNWCYSPADWERMIEESGVFTSGAIYPEAGRDANDVSRFAAETARELGVGRSLIVLRRD